MLAISARIEVAPDDIEAYIAAACLLYSFAVDIQHSNVLWITEQWQEESDLMAHLGAPHTLEFLAICDNLQVTDMNVIKFDVSAAGPLEGPQR